MSDHQKILVIAAHPDDEVLGCGGLIARQAQFGAEIKVLILATGKTSRHIEAPENDEAEIAKLYDESRHALSILGVNAEHIVFGNFPDQKLDTLPNLELIHFMKNHIQSFMPDSVYTHHRGDYNSDHQIVFDAVVFACRPYLGEHFPTELYSFEVLSSTEWAYQGINSFQPTMYYDISATIELKKQAMAAYNSELRAYPHPRSVESVENLAKMRGNQVSKYYAEAFELIRKIS